MAKLIIKNITPVLYNKIDFRIYMYRKNIFIDDYKDIKIRPFIFFIKKRNNKQLIGVEIGVHRGHNAKIILNELNIKQLYLIDSWVNYKGIERDRFNIHENYEYVLNLFKTDKRVIIIKNFSIFAVDVLNNNSLDFVYIDANHSFKSVYQDINIWYEKVKYGGVIAGHDIFRNTILKGHIIALEVLQAVKKFCDNKNIKFYIDYPDWYFIKK